jgi:hypothetical protein
MDDKEAEGHLKRTIAWALQKGIPPDMLEGISDAYEVVKLFERWERLKKLEEHDRNRVKAGMKTLRPKIMHMTVDPDDIE